MYKPKVVKNYQFPRTKEEMPLGPGSAAGVLIDVNSGWRTFRPVIDETKCSVCYVCWVVCPDGVIDKTGTKLEIDYDYCKGCGICAYECPSKAIDMIKESEK
ncbi:MAG: pyruvate ferredoxin oxidoreductase [Tissierellaceae bacterium]|nr:pyruvate ferredoxin oxidoreductase [Tissierellaceae bacterium]